MQWTIEIYVLLRARSLMMINRCWRGVYFVISGRQGTRDRSKDVDKVAKCSLFCLLTRGLFGVVATRQILTHKNGGTSLSTAGPVGNQMDVYARPRDHLNTVYWRIPLYFMSISFYGLLSFYERTKK